VRAAHLRVLSRILNASRRRIGLARITIQRPELASAFAATLAPLSWVDLAELISALDCTVDVAARDLRRAQGRPRHDERDVRAVVRRRPRLARPETVLAALPTFWSRYHDWGDVDVVVHSGSANISLTGYSGSTHVCTLIGAELERIVELTRRDRGHGHASQMPLHVPGPYV